MISWLAVRLGLDALQLAFLLPANLGGLALTLGARPLGDAAALRDMRSNTFCCTSVT